MINKRQVFVTIQYRDELSLGENRQKLGYAAYNWGILISPKVSAGKDCYAFDVSDAARPDPETRVDCNPNRDWVFRSKPNVDPLFSGHVLGRVMIGKVPNDIGTSAIEARLAAIPLPEKEAVPEQNCVSWTMSAIQALQEIRLAEQFDLKEFMAYAIRYADQRLKAVDATANVVNYTRRKK